MNIEVVDKVRGYMTTKGKQAYCYKNAYYFKKRVNAKQKTTNYTCRVTGCSSSLTLCDKDKTIKHFTGHSDHELLLDIEIEIRFVIEDMKERALREPDTTIQTIYDQALLNFKHKIQNDELVAQHFPVQETIHTILYRKKRSVWPAIPTSASMINLIDNLKYTKTISGDSFLISDPNDPTMLVFSSLTGLEALANSKTYFGDGTFKTCPKYFYQAYTLHGHYQNKVTLPCVFAFMPGKSAQDYHKLIYYIRTAAANNGHSLNPTRILLDFEEAAIGSFRANFPLAIIKGCHFHLCQSLYRKVCSIGLKTEYDVTASDFCNWIKMFMSLSMLPSSDIETGLDILIDIKNYIELLSESNRPRLDEFIHYFKTNYINGKFPIQLWCHWSSQFRTTNYCEGYHNKISKIIISPKPNIWKAIRVLQDLNDLVSIKFEKAKINKFKTRKVSQQLKEKDIKYCKLKFKTDENYEIFEYLREISNYVTN